MNPTNLHEEQNSTASVTGSPGTLTPLGTVHPVSAFFIKNHSHKELCQTNVTTLPTLSTRPHFSNKPDFTKWCHAATTEHVFYTLAEPEQPALRSSSQNKIKFLHGIVADYDGAAASIQAAIPTLAFAAGLAPAWVTTTFSGKARLLWLFEERVPVFSPELFTLFIRALAKELNLRSHLPGLDEGALTNPYTPYEVGTNWRQPFGDTRVSNHVVLTHLHDASTKVKWASDGPEIPLDVVEAEVNRRWPGRWFGPFVDGAKGVRFWDAKADNPTGVTIRTLGVQAFTGESKFLHWGEILGGEFVKQFRQKRIGGAIGGTYFDGKSYWRCDDGEPWRDINTESMKRVLGVVHRLSNECRGGQPSELTEALTTIETRHRVDGAFPCLFMKDTVVKDGGHDYLNIARAKTLQRTGITRSWGDGFPWLAGYLEGLFASDQRDVFLSWLAHFYKNAAAGKPRKGQALFVAGPPSSGKTFLSQRVVGGLVGGFQEATGYVLGMTNFNESLFFSAVWAVDDAVAASDPRRHAAYSEMVKKIVANPSQEFHAKFRKAVTHRFNGRLVVTLNDDPTSIEMLPRPEGAMLDKIVILRARVSQTSFVGADDKAAAELPCLADYLADFQTPKTLMTRASEVARFGHDSWHDPELLATAKDSSDSSGIHELLNMWREYHFRSDAKPDWSGSALQLYSEFSGTDVIRDTAKAVLPTQRPYLALGRGLQRLISQRTEWISYKRGSEMRVYTIKSTATPITATK